MNRTYREYLDIAKTKKQAGSQEAAIKITNRFSNDQTSFSRFAPVLYIVDYTTNSYVYVDEGCFDLMGYSANKWMEEGLNSYLERWHPADFSVMNNYVFPKNISFLQSLPLERYPDIIFSFNYRFLNAKGEYITILQRSSYIAGNEMGKPVGNVGVTSDISHFKGDNCIVHTIEEIIPYNGRPVAEIIYKQTYQPDIQHNPVLTPRELEILQSIVKGLSSKQIAHNLSLSLNTINNHRKNMLHKTGCHNFTELLDFALKKGCL